MPAYHQDSTELQTLAHGSRERKEIRDRQVPISPVCEGGVMGHNIIIHFREAPPLSGELHILTDEDTTERGLTVLMGGEE